MKPTKVRRGKKHSEVYWVLKLKYYGNDFYTQRYPNGDVGIVASKTKKAFPYQTTAGQKVTRVRITEI